MFWCEHRNFVPTKQDCPFRLSCGLVWFGLVCRFKYSSCKLWTVRFWSRRMCKSETLTAMDIWCAPHLLSCCLVDWDLVRFFDLFCTRTVSLTTQKLIFLAVLLLRVCLVRFFIFRFIQRKLHRPTETKDTWPQFVGYRGCFRKSSISVCG